MADRTIALSPKPSKRAGPPPLCLLNDRNPSEKFLFPRAPRAFSKKHEWPRWPAALPALLSPRPSVTSSHGDVTGLFIAAVSRRVAALMVADKSTRPVFCFFLFFYFSLFFEIIFMI